MKHLLIWLVLLLALPLAAEKIPAVYTVRGELNDVGRHAQGVCASEKAFFLSYAGGIYKLDRQGKVLKHVKTPVHTGDICFYNGKIYASTAYSDSKEGAGAIIEYSDDLEKLRVHKLPFPIDGITEAEGFFYFGAGPNPPELHRGNRIARMAADFSGKVQFINIDHGYETRYGCQTITSDGKYLFISFYGNRTEKMQFAVLDLNGKLITPMKFHAYYGFALLPGYYKSESPRFVRVVQLYSKNRKEMPFFRFDFYEYKKGKMTNITQIF